MQIVHEQKVVATHLRAERGRRTNHDHYPPEKIAFYQRTPAWCRSTAAAVGPACTQVIEDLMVDNALFRLRSAQGILGLRTKHGSQALEDACETALTAGDPSYRTVKGILVVQAAQTSPAGTGTTATTAPGSAAVPAFLRGPDDLFAQTPAASPTAGPTQAHATVLHLPTTSTTGTTSGRDGLTGAGTTSDPTLTDEILIDAALTGTSAGNCRAAGR